MASFEKEQFRSTLASLGRAGAHALFPNDFEYYMCALELVNSKGRAAEYFVFPVNPEAINVSVNPNTSITKTVGGVSVLKTTTFIPEDCTISGTFGRKLRFLIGSNFIAVDQLSFSTKGGVYQKKFGGKTFNIPSLNPGAKTGYGSTKILQSIVDKSTALDKFNNPYRLFFYCSALNWNRLVEVENFTLSQDKQSSNRMWKYSLKMKSIAPLDQLKNEKLNLVKMMAFDNLQKGATQVLSEFLQEEKDPDVVSAISTL